MCRVVKKDWVSCYRQLCYHSAPWQSIHVALHLPCNAVDIKLTGALCTQLYARVESITIVV